MRLEEKRRRLAENRRTIEELRGRCEPAGPQVLMRRQEYMALIGEVSAKVARQRSSLVRVALETRALQRELGQLSGRAERGLALASEQLLRRPESGREQPAGWPRNCRRLLSMMHESCQHLLEAVEESGRLSRLVRQLEERLAAGAR